MMNFQQALVALKEGKRISRHGWPRKNYLQINNDGDIINYTPTIRPYEYDQTIVLSDGWLVGFVDIQKEYSWLEVIELLKMGAAIRRPEWENMWIALDKESQSLVIHDYISYPFMPTFICFTSNDWIEL